MKPHMHTDHQIYAIRDGKIDPTRPIPAQALGGPFESMTQFWIWVIEKQEEKLTPDQRRLWVVACEAAALTAKEKWPKDQFAFQATILSMVRRGRSPAEVLKSAVGEGWEKWLPKLEQHPLEV